MRPLITATVAGLITLAAPAWADTWVLDFSGNICGAAGNSACSNYAEIGQNYGDVAGSLDVSHRSFLAATGVTHEEFLKYWQSSYSDLVDVAWGGASSTAYASEISFSPEAGQTVTLNSFDFGDYLDRNYGSNVKIYDGTGSVLLWDGGSFNPGATASQFAPAISSSNGLVLRWGPDGYDVGIDNISVSVTAVPEPGTWAMLLAGMGVVGTLARRRRA
jgi:PEP-CTERM motif